MFLQLRCSYLVLAVPCAWHMVTGVLCKSDAKVRFKLKERFPKGKMTWEKEKRRRGVVGKNVHLQSREKSLKQPEAPKILGQDTREPQSQDCPSREPCIGCLGTCDSLLCVSLTGSAWWEYSMKTQRKI